MIYPTDVRPLLEIHTVQPINSQQDRFSIAGNTIGSATAGSYQRFHSLQKRIREFEVRKEDWNGYNVSAPNADAIIKADRWIESVFRFALSRSLWLEPMVSPDENGDIVFEWQRGHRWLSVVVSADAIEFLREGDMSDGIASEGYIDSQHERETLWTWLMS